MEFITSIKIIDATKKLTIRHFKNFQSLLKGDDMIIILVDDIEIGTITIPEFPTIFSTATLSELEDEQIISFASENVILNITAKDYKKWTNPWWAARIFAEENHQQKIEPISLVINCEVFKRKKKTNETYDFVSFSSEKLKDVMNFVNSVRGKIEIQSLLEDAEVIYRFWYGDISDNDVSGTFEELQKKGVFVL